MHVPHRVHCSKEYFKAQIDAKTVLFLSRGNCTYCTYCLKKCEVQTYHYIYLPNKEQKNHFSVSCEQLSEAVCSA